jgi:hypothetical protein
MTNKRPESLPNLLKDLVGKHGDETALICDGERLTRAERSGLRPHWQEESAGDDAR